MNIRSTQIYRGMVRFGIILGLGVLIGGIILMSLEWMAKSEKSNLTKGSGDEIVAEACHIRCTDDSCILYHDTAEKVAFNLSLEETVAQAEFLNQVAHNADELIARYYELPESQHGKILNIDIARDLYLPYHKDPAKFSIATHAGAMQLISLLQKKQFDVLIQKKQGMVVFLAGGSAAGKGTASKKFLIPLFDKADVVLDGTFSHYNAEHSVIEELLRNKIEVYLVYVYRPIDLATESVIERSKKIGRMVPLSVIAKSHYFSLKTVLHILTQEDSKIHFYLITSGKTMDELKLVSEKADPSTLAFLKSKEYKSYEDALEQVIAAYEKTDKKGLTPDAIAEFEKDAGCARDALKAEGNGKN